MNLPPVFTFQYTTSAGPLVGGLLYSYAAGTSTPQATYTDQSGGTPNTNPVVLDSNGSAALWLNPSLSYKFVLTDSSGSTVFTRDNVVGVLTANAVATSSIQDAAVTTAKLAANSVTSSILQSDAAIDGNRAVGTNHIQNASIIRQKLGTNIYLAPNVQKFASGSGTYNPAYVFLVSSATATIGATYTNNSVTFTVQATISGATLLYASGPSVPLSNGVLTKASGTGDASINFSLYVPPLYMDVEVIGGGGGGISAVNGGGGGGGGGILSRIFAPSSVSYAVGPGGAAGAAGTASTFSTLSAGGGAAGTAIVGGAGGTNTASLGSVLKNFVGNGGCTGNSVSGASAGASAGSGGAGPFGGGAGLGGQTAVVGTAGAVNTGAGGGGGSTGGAGGSGQVYVLEYYQ